jgi:hypothetical protein
MIGKNIISKEEDGFMNLLLRSYAPLTSGHLHVFHRSRFLADSLNKRFCDASPPYSLPMKYGSHPALQNAKDLIGGEVQPSAKHAYIDFLM